MFRLKSIFGMGRIRQQHAALIAGLSLVGFVQAGPAEALPSCGTLGCADATITAAGTGCTVAWTSPPPVHYWCDATFTANFTATSPLPGVLHWEIWDWRYPSWYGPVQSGSCSWTTTGGCQNLGQIYNTDQLMHCTETYAYWGVSAQAYSKVTSPDGSVVYAEKWTSYATPAGGSPASPC